MSCGRWTCSRADMHLTKAIELSGDLPQAYVSLAQSAAAAGADEAVVELCREALDLDPTLAECMSCWLIPLARHGNTADAAEHSRIAVKINLLPDDDYAVLGLNLLRQGKHQPALRLLQAARPFGPATCVS